MTDITSIAKEIHYVVERATYDLGKDLHGLSVVDLVLDNFPNLSVIDAKSALVIAGVDHMLSLHQIRKYSN